MEKEKPLFTWFRTLSLVLLSCRRPARDELADLFMTALYQLFCQIPAFNWQQLDLESIMSSFRAQWKLFQAQVLGLGTQSGQKNVILEIKLQMPIYYVSHWTKFLCCSFLLTRKNNCFSGWSLAGLGCDLWQSLASCHRLWRTRGGGGQYWTSEQSIITFILNTIYKGIARTFLL